MFYKVADLGHRTTELPCCTYVFVKVFFNMDSVLVFYFTNKTFLYQYYSSHDVSYYISTAYKAWRNIIYSGLKGGGSIMANHRSLELSYRGRSRMWKK